METKPNKEERLLSLLLEGETIGDAIETTEKEFNQLRGNKPLGDFITVKGLAKHLIQFIDVKFKDFDGNEYILNVLRKIANE